MDGEAVPARVPEDSPRPVYIASDQHFGAPSAAASRLRELLFVRWLDHAAQDAAEIILLGDLFDFWFEWRSVVPRGYVRVLGKLAELRDGGLPITAYTGNHDLWHRDYFPQELGIPVLREPFERTWFGKRYFLAHGDALGPGDHGYKFIRRVFVSPVARWLFARLHPNFALWLANRSSATSRQATRKSDAIDKGEKEFLVRYVQGEVRQRDAYDYYVFGHRHLARWQPIGRRATLVVLGDWIHDYCYLKIAATGPAMMRFDPTNGPQPWHFEHGGAR